MADGGSSFWGWFKLSMLVGLGLGIYFIFLLIKKWLAKKGMLKYF